MSNHDTELYELCKSVFEKTGWDKTHHVILHFVTPGVKDSERIGEWHNNGDFDENDEAYPLYTSDYLLEKLPPVIQDPDDKKFKHVQMWINGDGTAHAGYVEPYAHDDIVAYAQKSDEMRKTLLKLTLTLHEANELTPPQKETP